MYSRTLVPAEEILPATQETLRNQLARLTTNNTPLNDITAGANLDVTATCLDALLADPYIHAVVLGLVSQVNPLHYSGGKEERLYSTYSSRRRN